MGEMRPDIHLVRDGAELRDWYWLKAELEGELRRRSASTSGSKAELTERLADILDGRAPVKRKSAKTISTFDWANEVLTLETVITDSYRNGPNARRFFEQHDGPNFKFNIAFMKWMKENVGRTLADAVVARREIAEAEKFKAPPIPKDNQLNAYTRAFHTANPGLGAAAARTCWAWKRARRGHNRYEDSDLIAVEAES